MKHTILILATLLMFPVLATSAEKDGTFLAQVMIPQARQILLRIEQTDDLPSTTNDVASFKIEYFDDGWLANLQLTNGWEFRFVATMTDTNVSVVHSPTEVACLYLEQKMIPLAQAFLQRIGQTNDPPPRTNQVKYCRIDWFHDRPGCTASLRLTNGNSVMYYTENGKSEVDTFRRPIKTYYNLVDVPQAKIDAVKALNLGNKLNTNTALVLAKKYFNLIGHKDENFHPPEILQCYWSGGEDNHGGRLPYFEITWYRNDVTKTQLDDHDSNAELKTVIIEVSGVDSSLISYFKGQLPIGSDF